MDNDRCKIYYINRKTYPRGDCYYISDLPLIGICLYTDSEYCVNVEAMTKGIHIITDDEAVFREKTYDYWAGEKGLFYNVNCWEVCHT